MILEITKDNFETVTGSAQKPVVIEFFSPTCAYCKMTKEGLSKLAEEQEKLAVYAECDITKDMELGQKFHVTARPTLVFLCQGRLKNKLTGFTHKQIIFEEIKKLL